MPQVEEIIRFADELLEIQKFNDLGPNGLQIPGRSEISKVATGVSANLEFLERAVASNADLLLVHHGLLWDFAPRQLDQIQAKRLKTVLCADVNLAMYHLPLDAHAEIGNNALLAKELGLSDQLPFGEFNGTPIGVRGRFDEDGIPAAELFESVTRITAREPLVIDSGPELITSLGIISGAAAGELDQAIELGLDAFITGEPKEHVFGLSQEAGIHFIAAGHYATETFGIRALGELLAKQFGLEHEFIDVPNPI